MSVQQLNKQNPNPNVMKTASPGNNCSKYLVLILYFQPLFSFLHQIPTIVDYKEVLSNIVSLERRTLHLYSFICELSLLNTSLCVYSPARLAAAALLLAKILHRQGKEPYFNWSYSMVSQSALSFQGAFGVFLVLLCLQARCLNRLGWGRGAGGRKGKV